MRNAIVLLILGVTFCFCSKPKPQTGDAVLAAAKDMHAVRKNDQRSFDKLEIKARLLRMGMKNIVPVFYDPPMPKPVKQTGIGYLR